MRLLPEGWSSTTTIKRYYTSLYSNHIQSSSLLHDAQPPKQLNNLASASIKQANATLLFTSVPHTDSTFLIIHSILPLPLIPECYLGL